MAVPSGVKYAIIDALRQRDAQGAAEQISKHLETARQDLVGADSI